ncbi:hypothetical protein [Chryseobacterium indologenes]|uniref:Uncharacterized protein n=1 Tax=Chryseobacterium indologenes TaxID=253 RepID=A0A0N0IW41_CHRID|nr:hypothetical protein [Chryseobacterium indologenes]KPE51014.1 hypothetical protein AOB46_12570 [Chryseobacterium indologenes]
MKLQPMTDFCLEILNENPPGYNETEMLTKISNYATFLKQPLTLGMFVTVDEKGEYWDSPTYYGGSNAMMNDFEIEKWDKAKEKVLFEGFAIGKSKVGLKINHYMHNSQKDIMIAYKINSDDWDFNRDLKCVECLCKYELELTPSALKQIES